MSDKIYVVGNKDRTKFLGIDEHSGGYPFVAISLGQAKWFYDISKAINATNHGLGGGVNIVFELSVVEVDINKVKKISDLEKQIKSLQEQLDAERNAK